MSHQPNYGLLRLQQEYGFSIPDKPAHNWRGKDIIGFISTLNIPCRLLATDGLLAIAVRGDGRTLLEIHLAAFVPDSRSEAPTGFRKGRRPRKVKLQEVLDWI